MKKLLQFLLGVMVFLPIHFAVAEEKSSAEWLLSYAGKSSNELRWDKRIEKLIRSATPNDIVSMVLEGLSGPPDPVYVVKNRFVSMSACVAHACPMKGFFWIDIQSKAGLGAVWGDDTNDPDRLLIGSNDTASDKLSAEAKLALTKWLAENSLHPNKVIFVEKTGKKIALNSTDFQPLEQFLPASAGPSFDCLKASGLIEKTICNNQALASADLSLSTLFSEIKKGHSDLSARKQLTDFQRAWIKDRNTTCSSDKNVVSCLDGSYKEQYKKLMNWLPQAIQTK